MIIEANFKYHYGAARGIWSNTKVAQKSPSQNEQYLSWFQAPRRHCCSVVDQAPTATTEKRTWRFR